MGHRLRTSRCSLGWSIEAAAKYFQVTERTWHNWESGAHRIPFAVYKLCRVLARLELPGDAWAGWSFQGATLITPEGRQIEPRDSSWWSLMVRNARSFSAAYNEAKRLRMLLADGNAAAATGMGSGAAAPQTGGEAAGLVPSKTTVNPIVSLTVKQTVKQRQDDVIMTSWPTLYDYQTPLTPLHAPKPTTSESPSTPCSALPWTPICGVQLTHQRPRLGPHLAGSNPHLKQNVARNPNPSQNPESSPEPKNRRSTNGTKPSANASLGASAMPAAAGAAKLASASGGTP